VSLLHSPYDSGKFFDEMFAPADAGGIRPHYQRLAERLLQALEDVLAAFERFLHVPATDTPPLIKAILQYSAQPIAGASLLQQGAGLLNVDGAVKLFVDLR